MEAKESITSQHRITLSRIACGEEIISSLKEKTFPDDQRTDLWKLSALVGGRSEEDLLLLDGLCCLLHLAISKNQNVVSLMQAAELHVERETGSRLRILEHLRKGFESGHENACTAGDRVLIHCLDTGRLWSEAHGWVNDPMEATSYDPTQIKDIGMPSGNCGTAEIKHIRDLFSVKGWNMRDPSQKFEAEVK